MGELGFDLHRSLKSQLYAKLKMSLPLSVRKLLNEG
jgi:hypothetical protein